MAKVKSLNIFNSDRKFNLSLTTKAEEEDFVRVTKLNEDEIELEMDKLKKQSGRFNKRNETTYLIYKERYSNDRVQEKILNHGGFIYYYTEDRAPLPIINKLAGIPQSEVIFYCQKEHKLDAVNNIHMSSMATKVSIDVPIVLPDINIYDYLFALHPLRYHVDKVKISFPALSEKEYKPRHQRYYEKHEGKYYLRAKYKYIAFTHLQDPLSTWKMNLWLVCDSTLDRYNVQEKVADANKRYRKAVDTKRKKSPVKGGKN